MILNDTTVHPSYLDNKVNIHELNIYMYTFYVKFPQKYLFLPNFTLVFE